MATLVASCFKGWVRGSSRLRGFPAIAWRWYPSRRGMVTRIFIVAGEPSGDAIGSRLMASLRCLSPGPLHFAGVGGPLMEKQGLQSEFQMEDIAVMGVVELIPHTFRLWTRMRQTIAAALTFEPNVVVTVDAKGFSSSVLQGISDGYAKMGRRRPRTVHYVSPSFWAWKGGEEKLMNWAKIVDHMLCILPFEEAVCKANGLPATFVGHPVLEDAHAVAASDELQDNHNACVKGDGATFRAHYGIDPGATVLSVLPGSRLQEVKRMLPIFEGALDILYDSVPDLTVLIPTVQSQSLVQTVETVVKNWKVRAVVLPGVSERDKYSAFSASNAGLCTSGTVVMQLLMARVPCVVGYRANLLTEWIIQSRATVDFISLPNILLSSAVIPEALFAACTSQELAAYLRVLLKEKSLQEKQLVSADKVISMLAPPLDKNLIKSSSGFSGSGRAQERITKPSMAAAFTILELLRNEVSQKSGELHN